MSFEANEDGSFQTACDRCGKRAKPVFFSPEERWLRIAIDILHYDGQVWVEAVGEGFRRNNQEELCPGCYEKFLTERSPEAQKEYDETVEQAKLWIWGAVGLDSPDSFKELARSIVDYVRERAKNPHYPCPYNPFKKA
jgi:hypothetical protein